MANEKFCLRWNDFETNISTAFRDLREDKDFFDVTLACDDQQIQAHKVILSACSPFFRQILHQNTHPHPLIYLRGVKFMDIQSVLNFMYHGEVNVAQEELNTFLSVAEDLKVKGLTQNQSESKTANAGPPSKSQTSKTFANKNKDLSRVKPSPVISSVSCADDDDIVEYIPVKSEPRDPLPNISDSIFTQPSPSPAQALTGQDETTLVYQDVETYDDYGQYAEEHRYQGLGETGADTNKDLLALLDAQIEAMMFRTDDKIWHCVHCDKRSVGKTDITRHIEATHLENHPGFPCELCGEIVKTRNALRQHKASRHKFI